MEDEDIASFRFKVGMRERREADIKRYRTLLLAFTLTWYEVCGSKQLGSSIGLRP
jgi:hypothetical protein